MAPLQNSAIEFPAKLFNVEMVVLGTLRTYGAIKRTVPVLAQTAKGARRICRARYQRSEIKSVREVGEPLNPFVRDRLSTWDECR
jgi:hypothetical protein